MKNDDKILNKYFESARNHKSPVSGTYARNLLGNSDLKKSVPKKFVFKKGVKTMSIISTLTVGASLLAISLGLFNTSTEQTANVNSKTATRAAVSQNSQHGKASKEQQNISIAKNTTPKPTNSNETNSTNSDNVSVNVISKNNENAEKVEPFKKIEMTYEELEDFGFEFGNLEYEEKELPFVGYFSDKNQKIVDYHKYTTTISTHAFLDIDSVKSKGLPDGPSMIADYNGVKHAFSYILGDSRATVKEFIPFVEEIQEINYIHFRPELAPKSVPDSIEQCINETDLLLSRFISSESLDTLLSKSINNNLSRINTYFAHVSYPDSIRLIDEERARLNPRKDTIGTRVMHIFVDNPKDTIYKQSIADYAKMGITAVYLSHPVYLNKFIEEKYPSFSEKIQSLAKQAEDYVQTNDMIAIDVPFKDDPKKEGMVFWFMPSKELIEALPERYRVGLSKELELKNNGVSCGQHFEEATYMDSWRACSGAIENLRVFPNPVVRIVNVKFDLKEAREMKFAIHSLNGNKLTDLPLLQKFDKGTNTVTLDLSMLTSGMYLLVASSPEGETTVQRIIKE